MRHSASVLLAIGFSLAGALAACGGADGNPAGDGAAGSGGNGMAAAGKPAAVSGSGGQGSGSSTVAPATFTAVYALITAKCAGVTCHVASGTKPGGGLAMGDRATAYKNLVGMASVSCRGEKRVVANNPDKSEFVHSLDRTKLGTCMPPQMPEGQAKLSQSDIDTVVGWVKAGAPNN